MPSISSNLHKFSHSWLEDRRFKDWLQEVEDDPHSFRCRFCSKNEEGPYSCRSGRISIQQHSRTKIHTSRCIEAGIEVFDDLDAAVDLELPSSFQNRKTAMEIQYAAFISKFRLSYRVAASVLKFFKALAVRDPVVLQDMQMGKSKISCVVGNVLGNAEKERLVRILKKLKFSIYLDKSVEANSGVHYLVFVVRYIDPVTFNVVVQLFEFIELDAPEATADVLFEKFNKVMVENGLPYMNIVAYSSDNEAVMVGEGRSMKTHLLYENPNIFHLGCPCHKFALIAEKACECIPSEIDTLLKKLIAAVHHGTKKGAQFQELQNAFDGSSLRLLNFCTTRWLSRHECISRVLKLWDKLLLFVREVVVSENNSKFLEILEEMENTSTQAYLAFLEYNLRLYNKYNLFFHNAKTRIHLLHSKCAEFIATVARHFIKDALIPHVSQGAQIDYSSAQNQLPLDTVDFGPQCNDILSTMPCETNIDQWNLRSLRQCCVNFYIKTVAGIASRFELGDGFLKDLSVFTPGIISDSPNRDTTFQCLESRAKIWWL